MHIQFNEAHYFFTRDVKVCFSFPGEPVKIELIQLIPPGTTDIISQKYLNKYFCRLLTTVESLFAFYCSFTAGEILASFEEDARSFLFPEPKLVPSFSGVEREVLMTRHPNFPVSAYLFTILIEFICLPTPIMDYCALLKWEICLHIH